MIDLLRETIVESMTVLRVMEWSKIRSETGWSSNGFCPSCDGPKFSGHKRGCPLGEALAKCARSLKAIYDAPPDKHCISLPDGSCVGRGCMHDTSESGGTADAVASNPTA